MNRISNEVIDELVAGELSGAAYRQLLHDLDREPGGWKRCALAFLEDQAWQQDLTALAGDGLQPPTASNSAELVVKDGSAEDQVETELAPTASGHENAKTQAAAKHRRQLEWMSRFTSLAALLLVSFTIGWFGSDFKDTSGLANRRAENASEGRQEMTPTESVGNKAAKATAAGPFELGQANSVELVSDELIPWEQRPPEYLEQLQRRGQIELEFSDAFVPVEDGGVVRLVPVRQYSVRPKVFSY